MQSLLLGAPRYQHIGLVVIFKKDAGAWEKNAEIKGSQVSAECVGHGCANRGTLGAKGFWDGHHQIPSVAESCKAEGFKLESHGTNFAFENVVSSLF